MYLPQLDYQTSGGKELKINFLPEVSVKNEDGFVYILCMSIFAYSKHEYLV